MGNSKNKLWDDSDLVSKKKGIGQHVLEFLKTDLRKYLIVATVFVIGLRVADYTQQPMDLSLFSIILTFAAIPILAFQWWFIVQLLKLLNAEI